ncbi:MAG: non-ribosomal peptide synthetase component F [Halioglobus sp.]
MAYWLCSRRDGAYLPLDPGYPSQRLDYMLSDSGASSLLSRSELSRRLINADISRIELDSVDWAGVDLPDHGPGIDAGPDSLAYVIYTSGSTDKPKGVAGTHGAILNRLSWNVAGIALWAGRSVLPEDSAEFRGLCG